MRKGKGCLTLLLLVCILGACVAYFLTGSKPSLELWHTEKLPAEFSTEKQDEIKTFDDYLRLEGRLFSQLDSKVVTPTQTGAGNELARYSAGSAADPRLHKPNWNRSFELSHEKPVGGVLLLHGMSDSPYSLQQLGERFNQQNYWIIGLRLPGHGTAPSGLTSITWEDMAAAVELAIEHLAAQVGDKPIHLVGYSTGAPLALNYTLDALEGRVPHIPGSLILISPAIGIHPLAGLAKLKNWVSIIPGLKHLAWLSVEPEFDPYKYNSFATNAAVQVHRLTQAVAKRLRDWTTKGQLDSFPPTLVFKSTIDATVSTTAVIDRLLKPLKEHGHELVLYDINRYAAKSPLLVTDPGPLTNRLMEDNSLPFAVTFITNESPDTMKVIARHKPPHSGDNNAIQQLELAWPTGVISLSHVALPFSADDPLYGQRPPDNKDVLFLGQMALQGERGLLKISTDWLVRLRHNPFYSFLEERSLNWLNENNS